MSPPTSIVPASKVINTVLSRTLYLSECHFVVVVVNSSHQSPCLCVSRFRSTQSITIVLSGWSALKGSRKGGGCHESNDHNCGNGCALSGRFSSCTDQGFGSDWCAVVPV